MDEKKTLVHDAVNHPSHYNQGGIECIDAIQAAVTNLAGPEAWLTGSAIKYLWRWRHKNGLADLQKAKFYLDRLIKLVDNEETKRKIDEERLYKEFEALQSSLDNADETPK